MNKENYSPQVERAAQELERQAVASGGVPCDVRPLLAQWEWEGRMVREAQKLMRAYPPSVGKRRR